MSLYAVPKWPPRLYCHLLGLGVISLSISIPFDVTTYPVTSKVSISFYRVCFKPVSHFPALPAWSTGAAKASQQSLQR